MTKVRSDRASGSTADRAEGGASETSSLLALTGTMLARAVDRASRTTIRRM